MVRKNIKTIIVLVIMGMLCMNGCAGNRLNEDTKRMENEYMKISAKDAKEIMDGTEDYVLVDVREMEEYAEGHIEGAILIPYGEIEKRAEEELTNKEQMILVYCRSGRRSAIAAQALVDMGYTNVRDFGGIIDWPYDVTND